MTVIILLLYCYISRHINLLKKNMIEALQNLGSLAVDFGANSIGT